jgi:hypothetical protein
LCNTILAGMAGLTCRREWNESGETRSPCSTTCDNLREGHSIVVPQRDHAS